MKVDVYNLENKVIGSIDLPDSIFAAKWRPALVTQVLRAQLANKRKPWAHAKTRSEVRGGGRKPWRQKGTGRARHGSIRSPLWVGGGKAHGPTKERDYSQKINKKMKRQAAFSALSRKLKENEAKVFESFALEQPKTKFLAGVLRNILATNKKSKKYNALIVAGMENNLIFRAASNLQKVKVIRPNSLNLYDLLNYKNLLIEKSAAEEISKIKNQKSK